jgi:hypothetical protein
LTVELDARAEPIQGRILDPGGSAHEFSGYMGLIEVFERLRPPVDRRTGELGSDPESGMAQATTHG